VAERNPTVVSEWQAFLRARGARIEEGVVQDFGDPTGEGRLAAAGDLLADLSHLGLVRVDGPDGASLLQGQQTGDIREVTPERSQPSGLCSNKGRLLATYRVVRRDDAYFLILPRSQVASVAARLRMYVLRSRVGITDASGEPVLLGLQGAVAADRAAQALGELPVEMDAVRQHGARTAVRLRGGVPRFLLMTPSADAPALWDFLSEVARPAGGSVWELCEIHAGVPSVYPATADAFVPQMINYEAIGGVSFTKGCYTGQEVVARTQYLGKLKRRMYRAHVVAHAPPVPGQDLYSAADPSGQSVGKVVAAEPDPEGGYALLAVIQNEAAQSPVHLGQADGPLLALQDMPYPV